MTALAGVPDDPARAAWWALLVTLLIVAPLLGYVLLKSATGELAGIHVAVRQQRDALYLAELLLLLAALLVVTQLQGPEPLRLLLISLTLTLLPFYIINKRWKISLHAARDGLLSINTPALAAFNMIEEVMCATLHSHTLVKKGEQVAATRAIPLVMKRAPVERAAAIAAQDGGAVSVKALRQARAGLVITGNEVYHGLIEDKFASKLSAKITDVGSTVDGIAFAPDDEEKIVDAIRSHLENGCDLLLLSGGMSVDPDDVTRSAIRQAGADDVHYGAAVLAGAMFLVAYIGDVPLLGVPACGLHHRITVLDLVLPRILAGERIGRKELAFMGHGGLCQDCPECTYPKCAFGRGC
jgi:molybdenum cofactor synthesis domain-containing protein